MKIIPRAFLAIKSTRKNLTVALFFLGAAIWNWSGLALAADFAFVEPLTGSRVMLPEAFQDGQAMESQGGHILSSAGEASQVEVSVREMGAQNIYDVLAGLIMSPEDKFGQGCEILGLSPNFIDLREEDEAFGEPRHQRHRAWLLNDGSYLYVRFETQREEARAQGDQIKVEFGAEAAEGAPTRLEGLGGPGEDEDGLSGLWAREDGQPALEIYGGKLLRFRQAGGETTAVGLYDPFWKKLSLGKGETAAMAIESSDSIGISEGTGGKALAGNYKRLEGPGAPPEPIADGYRGQWENDAEYCLLHITRSEVSVTTDSGASSGSYEETPEGLRMMGADGDVLIRPTDDGGLTMDGRPGVFYRAGLGKGADRFANLAPYKGRWINHETGRAIDIQDGAYAGTTADGGVSMGSATVGEDGVLSLGGDAARLDPDNKDRLIVEGDQGGVYERAPQAQN